MGQFSQFLPAIVPGLEQTLSNFQSIGNRFNPSLGPQVRPGFNRPDLNSFFNVDLEEDFGFSGGPIGPSRFNTWEDASPSFNFPLPGGLRPGRGLVNDLGPAQSLLQNLIPLLQSLPGSGPFGLEPEWLDPGFGLNDQPPIIVLPGGGFDDIGFDSGFGNDFGFDFNPDVAPGCFPAPFPPPPPPTNQGDDLGSLVLMLSLMNHLSGEEGLFGSDEDSNKTIITLLLLSSATGSGGLGNDPMVMMMLMNLLNEDSADSTTTTTSDDDDDTASGTSTTNNNGTVQDNDNTDSTVVDDTNTSTAVDNDDDDDDVDSDNNNATIQVQAHQNQLWQQLLQRSF
ncbi:MAG: hypothetical protein SFZ03_02880 [Candidatus Melainabacteria bacterium]|nr:hypothetical protein [Candidatus Melainabacteria bacterium]